MPFEYNNETWRTEGSEYIGLDVTYFIGWSGKIIGWLKKLSQYTSVTYMRLRVSKQIFPGICGVGFQKIPGNIQGIQLKKKG
jgi:hypothetical protein